jgi:hypothetical protein
MFTKPEHGWINFTFKEFSERASYETDIPNDCLDAFIYALQNNIPAVVYFDAEGYDYYLLSTKYDTYVIIEKNKLQVYTINKNIEEIAEELIQDIENNFEDWLNWMGYEEDYYEKNKGTFKIKLDKLKLELDERKDINIWK